MISLRLPAQTLFNTAEDFLASSYGDRGEFQAFQAKRQAVQDAAFEAANTSADRAERLAILKIYTTTEANKGYTDGAQTALAREWPAAKAVMLLNAMMPPAIPNNGGTKAVFVATPTAKLMSEPIAVAPPQSLAMDAPSQDDYSIQKTGDYWTVRFDKEEKKVQAKGNKGFPYIVELLRSRCQWLMGVELYGRFNPRSVHASDRKAHNDEDETSNLFSRSIEKSKGSFQPTYDDEALKAFKKRFDDLIDLRDVARTNGDDVTEEKCEKEINGISKAIRESTGLNGRQRNLQPADPKDKAYNAVQKSIRRTIGQLKADSFPAFGRYLEETIRFSKPQIAFQPSYDPFHPDISWKV